MKDKIVFFILGMLVIVIVLVITNTVNNPVAQVDTQAFENVIIKGKLIIGNKDNNITLENKDGSSQIIISTSGCGIALTADDENALVILSNEKIVENIKGLPDGISLFTSKDRKIGQSNSLIYLTDDKGKKIMRSID